MKPVTVEAGIGDKEMGGGHGQEVRPRDSLSMRADRCWLQKKTKDFSFPQTFKNWRYWLVPGSFWKQRTAVDVMPTVPPFSSSKILPFYETSSQDF